MFKRLRSKRLSKQKDSRSENSEGVSNSSERDITWGRLSELLPSTGRSISHCRSPSPSATGLGLHILHQPDYALIDIVFVHGLGGHSRRTWSKNYDPSLFWPQLWLPFEPGFESCRIFTFGYDAAFRGATKSVSNVTDFAKELLFEMRFGKDESGEDLNLGASPIIFIGHSMGGLVTKKACLLGLQDANYQALVQAVSAIMFLSTPHRGTHLAKILNRVLSASFQSSRNFISDLDKGSSAIEEINEQFRHLAPKLSIWSFYETLATSIGPRQIMVLEKDSSVLGYPGEISRPLQADHHDVCKFSSPTDPNYIAVRNAIKTLVKQFRERVSEIQAQATAQATLFVASADEDIKIQDHFRDCPSTEADYDACRRCWIPGTCEWFLQEEEFISWLDTSSLEPAVLWYTAPPANGKSVLSAFVINHLRNKNLPCQFFLFKYSDDSKRMVANCVKSLAFQLSSSCSEFKRQLAKSSRESLGLDSSDPFLICKKVIEGTLAKSDLIKPIYWVIDALDECDSPKTFLECLKSLSDKLPVRILILSRNTNSISMGIHKLSRSISVLKMEKSKIGHNQKDIELLVGTELDRMRGSSGFRNQLLQDIMERSEGNFLWVQLVLEEVMACHTEGKIREVLDSIPNDMTRMFQRMELNLLASVREADKPLIGALLEWSTCAQRPLSLKEMSQALQPEYSGFLDLKRTIQETCGQFVHVDVCEKVTVLHHTTREYFTHSSESELHINPEQCHEKLFTRTLKIFEDVDLRWRLQQNENAIQSDEPFIFYSAVCWPFHLSQSASLSSESLDTLVNVIRGPGIMTWIHSLALLRRLDVLVSTSQVLAVFVKNMKRRNESVNSASDRLSDLDLLSEWATDLIKLMGRFASKILDNPGVLYYIVPVVCPSKSITYKQFHDVSKINVLGVANGGWSDRLCRLDLPRETQGWEIACAAKHLAVLDSNGSVHLWDTSSFSDISVIHHGEPVTAFAVNGNGDKLCTYGLKSTKLWSILSGELIGSTASLPYIKAKAIVFADNDSKLLLGTDDNAIRHMEWDKISRGWQILENNLLKKTVQIDGALVGSPICLAFNEDKTLVGASYRGAPLYVWRLRDGACINIYKRAGNMRVDQSQLSSNWFAVNQFTWNRVTGHILGICRGGWIFKWHPITDENTEIQFFADEISLSPNGKLFATSSTDGSIRIWSFACFRAIYQLSSEDLVTRLIFSPDSRRFYDLRQGTINAWEPDSLTQFLESHHTSDCSNENKSSITVIEFSEESVGKFGPVTAFSPAPNYRSYCVGYEDGNVEIYETGAIEGRSFTRFFNYMAVTKVRWSPNGRLVALADLAGEIQIWEFKRGVEGGSLPSKLPSPDFKLDQENFEEFLFSLDESRLLIVSTRGNTFVFSTRDGKLTAKSHIVSCSEKWLCHPTRSDIILRCGCFEVDAYKWDTLEHAWSVSYFEIPLSEQEDFSNLESRALTHIGLAPKPMKTRTVDKALLTQDCRYILLFNRETTYPQGVSNRLDVVPVATLGEKVGTIPPNSCTGLLLAPSGVVSNMLIPLGILPERRLVFIDQDLWVCSYPLGKNFHSATGAPYYRFYFIPRDWVTRDSLEQCILADDGTLFWPKGDGIVRIECDLDETRLNSVF
ncbi:hypothetical protein F5Y03DRAFT_352235 [Xylaria venustula]|nr:hypothetical protein F5Y03DRAFT_352235 [Xylaria venustula]